jgi:N-methylhydantoinase A
MGILDPEGFAAGEMRLDVELARKAFEELPTPLSFDDRVGYAFRIAVANIAEEVTNVAVRHGVDPRDFSLVAYGAAGPMLLPAALSLLQARRVIVPPHPGLFSALGLLSTDLVFYSSRSSYVVLTEAAAPAIAEVFEQMETQLRATIADDSQVTVRRSFDGRLMGQSWETPFVELPDGPIDESMITQMITLFHEQYERRYGNRFEFVPVQGVTYRVQLIVPSEKVEYVPLEAAAQSSVLADRILELRYYEDSVLGVGEYRRESLPIGARVIGPAIIREDLSTTLVCPRQVAEIGRCGEIVIEQVDA